MRYDLHTDMTCAEADEIRLAYFAGDMSKMPQENSDRIAFMDSVKGGNQASGFFNAVTAFYDEWNKMTKNGYSNGYANLGAGTVLEQTVEGDEAATQMCGDYWSSRNNYVSWENDEYNDDRWQKKHGDEYDTWQSEQIKNSEEQMISICYNVGTRSKYFKPTCADLLEIETKENRVPCDDCVHHVIPE